MGIRGLAPGPGTAKKRGVEHRIYPYLLRGKKIKRPGQVWAADITYIPMSRGFVYLVAVMDWYSRKVLSWRISNTMDNDFCVDALEEALCLYGQPVLSDDQRHSECNPDCRAIVMILLHSRKRTVFTLSPIEMEVDGIEITVQK